MPERLSRVAIVGAGFSGTLLAVNLVRHDGPDALLIERGECFGRGIAYSTGNPDHLLNVRAANMSALPDDPGHFIDWLGANDAAATAATFVPRATYGTYLGDLLERTRQSAGSRLSQLGVQVVAACPDDHGVTLAFADGGRERAGALVLATGNLPPHAPAGLDVEGVGGRYVGDPWDAGVANGLAPGDTVLLLGTGLTMVDVALTLDRAGFPGRIVALSRRGLLPRAWGERARQPRNAPAGRGSGAAPGRAPPRRRDRLAWRHRRAAPAYPGPMARGAPRRTCPLPAPPEAVVGRAPSSPRASGR